MKGVSMKSFFKQGMLLGFTVLFCSGIARARSFETLLTQYDGEVTVRYLDGAEITVTEADLSLEPGDIVRTGKNAHAEVTVEGEGMFLLGGGSVFVIGDPLKKKGWFQLEEGTLLLKIDALLRRGEVLQFRSKTMVAAVRGTEGAIDVEDNGTTHVGLFEGEMEVFSLLDEDGDVLSEPVLVSAGMQTQVDYLKNPLRPFALKERMIRHRKKVGTLKKRLPIVRKRWKKALRKRKKQLRRKLHRKGKRRIKKQKDKRRIRKRR